MRIDHETWYEMRLCFDLDTENNVVPTFKRVQFIKLVNDYYLCSSCDLCTHVGAGCAHVAKIIDEINVYFWHIINWKSHVFYYLCDGTLLEVNNIFENQAFINSPTGLCWDKVTSNETYPFFSANNVTANSFTVVFKS